MKNIGKFRTEDDVESWLEEKGFEGTAYFTGDHFAPAIIGYTEDERLVDDYDKMVRWLAKKESWDEVEAIEWIDYNTIRTIPYMGEKSPVIVYHDALC